MLKRVGLILVCAFGVVALGTAQTLPVKKDKAPLQKEYGDGFEVVLSDASYDEVQSELSKWMKTFGKTKGYGNAIVVEEPSIEGVALKGRLFGQARQTGNIISAWIGILTDEWREKEIFEIEPALQKSIYDFGVHFRKTKIQNQIDESVRAAQAVEKQQQRLRNQERDLHARIENNKEEKAELEAALEKNKLDLETLTKRLEKNKKDQDSVAVAAEQINKAIELHKHRHQNVQ